MISIFARVSGALLLILALTSCGGGTTAGVGGSGIGGTGVTLVRGNVATVTAALESDGRGAAYARMLAGLAQLLSREAIAQAGGVSGIRVSGGGRQDVTDDLGRFDLIDVAPSSNFVLTLVLPDGQRIDLGIGAVPDMSAVEVNNIVVDARRGTAAPSSIEVSDLPDGDSADGGSTEDGDSVDDDSPAAEDPPSTDEPDSPSTDEDKPADGDSIDPA